MLKDFVYRIASRLMKPQAEPHKPVEPQREPVELQYLRIAHDMLKRLQPMIPGNLASRIGLKKAIDDIQIYLDSVSDKQ